MYLLGYDCGTSFVKASIINAQSQNTLASAFSPQNEMPINAHKQGWAEQNPHHWWENLKIATQKVLTQSKVDPDDIEAIGISYQMHGLVCVDKLKQVLRPAIIWCDNRAVEIGDKAFDTIGHKKSLEHLLNSPGNFTASKIKWIKENQREIYDKIYKIMLPGDYIAMKMTGSINTTISGLSEAMLWDFKDRKIADIVLENYAIDKNLIPELLPTFSIQGRLTNQAAAYLGLKVGTKITYRAGDQPNNALSLNVLKPGEIAATAGTSGVVCGISDTGIYDMDSRVNTFAHVNYTTENPVLAVLMCVAGTGILNRWLKHNISNDTDYHRMNELAKSAPIGCDGLCVLPFGNGSERILQNRNISASIHNINFNIHNKGHIIRAAQEGIVFALNYGLSIMNNMGIKVQKVKAGQANMFLSPVFTEAFATVTGASVQLYKTDGSSGAARAAGIGAGIYNSLQQAFENLKSTKTIDPVETEKAKYQDAYNRWLKIMNKQLS